MPYEISNDNGTHIEGKVLPPSHPRFSTYTRRRNEGPGYRPFPEWVFPPINVGTPMEQLSSTGGRVGGPAT